MFLGFEWLDLIKTSRSKSGSNTRGNINNLKGRSNFMNKLLKLAAAAAVGASLTTGIAAAQSGGSIDNTGYNSDNKVITKNINKAEVDNDNHLRLSNNNNQNAYSGEVDVKKNTNAGNAASGNASNGNSLSATVSVSNDGLAGWSWGSSDPASGGSIDTTGANSNNVIVNKNINKLDVDNDNTICVTNTNTQVATSGSVEVEKNTNAGSATSGNASNSNSSSFNLSVAN
ncbi:hypothetical protein COU91_00765 [Candidatus Saccharibacteria bacterium CG10_big_fil_rev_8_21_14_0_10_47_8]|nr:MAG: hypothetical protein COU91_00765 [Candidatus Saccharibacteria bacterium CG10_big_fil_rev_8_21_14_0_10_47_8]